MMLMLQSGCTRPDGLHGALFAVGHTAERADDGECNPRATIGLHTLAALRRRPHHTGRVNQRVGDSAGGGLMIPMCPGGSNGLGGLRKAAFRHEPVVAGKESRI